MTNSKRLGKGISELLSGNMDCIAVSEKVSDQWFNVPINLLHPSKLQPRKVFDEKSLKELSDSIVSNGIVQPILVRKSKEKRGYEIVAGERRWRASIIAKLKEMPVIIREINDQQSIELSIIENIQRQDLNPIEEAEVYQKLIKQFSYTHEDLVPIVGKSRSHITNMMRILTLPNSVKVMISQGILSFGHARALVNVQNSDKIAEEVVRKQLNVRQTELLIRTLQNVDNKIPIDKVTKSEDIVNLERFLSEKLNAIVRVKESKGKGAVIINFKNIEHLNLILKNIKN